MNSPTTDIEIVGDPTAVAQAFWTLFGELALELLDESDDDLLPQEEAA